MTTPELSEQVADGVLDAKSVERPSTWSLRPATIVTASAITPLANFDGDGVLGDAATPVPLTSLTGYVFTGERVMVLTVPPSGNYALAPLSAPAGAQLLDVVETNVATTQTTAGAAELDLSRLALPNISVVAGQLYRLDLQVINTKTVASDEFIFRLRESTALTGTILGEALAWPSNTSGQYFIASIYWTASTTASLDLFISVVRNAGSGTMTIYYQQFANEIRTRAALYWVGNSSTLRIITS